MANTNLSVGDNPDDFAVLDDFLEVTLDGFLSQLVTPPLGGLGEGLLLALVPIITPTHVHRSKFPAGRNNRRTLQITGGRLIV